jgi:hypothetical protein
MPMPSKQHNWQHGRKPQRKNAAAALRNSKPHTIQKQAKTA